MATDFEKANVTKESYAVREAGSQKDVITVYNGDPNTFVTATKGALCIDYTNGALYQNTNSSTAWTNISALTGSLPQLLLRKSGNQSISGANVVTGFIVDKDTHSGFASNKYAFPYDGEYLIHANAQSVNIVGYRINNGTDMWMGNDSHSGGDSVSGGSKLISVNAGDYLEFIVSSSSTLLAADEYTYFSIFKFPASNFVSTVSSIKVRYVTTSGQSIPDSTETVVDFDTMDYDAGGNVTTGSSWKFTASEAAAFRIYAHIFWSQAFSFSAGQSVQLSLYKNGSYYSNLDIFEIPLNGPQYVPLRGSDSIDLLPGDYIDIRAYQNTGSAVSLDTSGGFNYVNVEKTGT
jgi:hypothetical protein